MARRSRAIVHSTWDLEAKSETQTKIGYTQEAQNYIFTKDNKQCILKRKQSLLNTNKNDTVRCAMVELESELNNTLA